MMSYKITPTIYLCYMTSSENIVRIQHIIYFVAALIVELNT